MKYSILHIEDSKTDADVVKRLLERAGIKFSYHLASDKKEMKDAVRLFQPNVVLCDHSMPSFDSKMAYTFCKDQNPSLAFILVTGTVSEEFAVDMLNTGVDDYLLKTNLQRLPVAIERAVAKHENEKRMEDYRFGLQQSEAHLRTIFDNITTGVILLNKSGVILEMNDRSRFYEIALLERPYCKGDNLLEIAPLDRQPGLRKKFNACLQGERFVYESVYEQKDNTVVTFDVKISPTLDAQGTITGVCISFDDISERKRLEHARRENEIFNRSILTSIDHHIAVVAANGEIISVNKAWDDYSLQNGEMELTRTGVGSNYLHVCQKSASAGNTMAANALRGLREVLNKTNDFFEMEYPCHSPSEERWFLLRIVKFADDSPKAVVMHIDVSNLKKAGNELKRITNRLLLATSSAGMGIWDWDLKSDKVLWDEGMCRLYNINEPHNGSYLAEWMARLHPADYKRVNEEIKMAIAEKSKYNSQFRIVWDDGSVHYVKATGVAEIDEAGNVNRMIGLNWDITERILAENEIQNYKLALDESSLVDISNEKGIILHVNEKFSSVSKYPTQELVGQNHRILNSGYHDEAFFQHLWTTITAGKIWRNEIRNNDKYGNFFWVDTTIVPFVDADGKPFQFITIGKDITPRKNAESQMAAAVERYDILAEATSDTIWDWDVANDVIHFNKGIIKVFGYPADNIDNPVTWWSDRIHSEDREKVSELLKEVFKSGTERVQLYYRFRCADGSYKNIFDRAFIIFDSDGIARRVIGAMQDITYQVEEDLRIEKARIEAQEAERQYLGAELHDNINQILTGASLILSVAQPAELDPHERTAFVSKAMAHIKEAIEEIRQLSHRFAPAVLDDCSLEELFAGLLTTMIQNKSIVTKLVFDGVNGEVLSENIQINLYRILQEQTKNILKYADAKRIDINVTVSNDTVTMRIIDDGKGFDTKAKKAGIGLTNIKKRAESLLGKFFLASAPGKGCIIEVQLPVIAK